MPYDYFYTLFPEVAAQETRTVTILPGSNVPLPPDEYGFAEMFCDEDHCDCRRVFLSVFSRRRGQLEAVIAFGWEPREFYVRWFGDDDPEIIDSLLGPCLNLGSPQSKLAPTLLHVAEGLVLKDSAYIDRIKRHYRMFRDRIDEQHRRPAILKFPRPQQSSRDESSKSSTAARRRRRRRFRSGGPGRSPGA